MRRNGGFTLIELIVVIIILGLLAATAAPKFLNLQKEARVSALKGLKGAMESAASLVYSKAVITGVETSSSAAVSVGTSSVTTNKGYPTAAATGIEEALDLSTNDWTPSSATGVYMFYPNTESGESVAAGCHVKYTWPSGTDNRPKIEVIDNLC